MALTLSEFITQFFKVVETKDIDSVISYFKTDAVLIDPHYPNAHMKGREEIIQGLIWSCKNLKKFSFTIINYFESVDGLNAAVEVATAHELPNGKKINSQQTFIFVVKDGQISRLQAYEPYGPHGVFGLILGITRLFTKITTRN